MELSADYFPTLEQLEAVRRLNLDNDECLMILMNKFSIVCPICGKQNDKWYRIRDRKVFIHGCGYQFSLLSVTIFKKSSIGLRTWYDCIYDIRMSAGQIPVEELKRRYKLGTKTAWRMKYLIMKHLSIKLPSNGGYSYKYSSKQNGRYSQENYRKRHGLV